MSWMYDVGQRESFLDTGECQRPSIVRATDQTFGRHVAAAPGSAPLSHLSYGRIHLEASMPPVYVSPGDRETGLVCLKGSGAVRVGTERYDVTPYDTVYIPRDTHFMVSAAPGGIDMAEVSVAVETRHVPQWTPFEHAWSQPGRWWRHGDAAIGRDSCILLGEHVSAGRLLIGVTVGRASGRRWPPVVSDAGLELASLYVNLPDPTFEVAIDDGRAAYTVVDVVREGDLVIGRHGCCPPELDSEESLAMLWMLASARDGHGRQLSLSGEPVFARNPS